MSCSILISMGAPINSMGAIAKDMNWHHYYYRAIANDMFGYYYYARLRKFLGLFLCDSPLRFQCENQMGE